MYVPAILAPRDFHERFHPVAYTMPLSRISAERGAKILQQLRLDGNENSLMHFRHAVNWIEGNEAHDHWTATIWKSLADALDANPAIEADRKVSQTRLIELRTSQGFKVVYAAPRSGCHASLPISPSGGRDCPWNFDQEFPTSWHWAP